jgi:hypothetical protein
MKNYHQSVLYELPSALADGKQVQHTIGFSQTFIKISIILFALAQIRLKH